MEANDDYNGRQVSIDDGDVLAAFTLAALPLIVGSVLACCCWHQRRAVAESLPTGSSFYDGETSRRRLMASRSAHGQLADSGASVRVGGGAFERFLVGGRQLSALPISLSMASAQCSAIFLLGIPHEASRSGVGMALLAVVDLLVSLAIALPLVALMRRLHLRTLHHYLELRFARATRQLIALLSATVVLLLLTLEASACESIVAELGPALSRRAAAAAAALLVPALCVFLGGFRLIVWTSILQLLCVIGLLSFNVFRLLSSWNFVAIEQVLRDDLDRSVQSGELYAYTIGGFFLISALTVASPVSAQHLAALRYSPSRLRTIALALCTKSLVVIVFTGALVLGGFLRSGDGGESPPLAMLPHWLRVGAVLCASWATLAAGFGGVGFLLVEDFLVPLSSRYRMHGDAMQGYVRRALRMRLSDKTALTLSRVAIAVGVSTTILLLAAAKSTMPTSLIESQSTAAPLVRLSLSVVAAIGGPILGVYLAGLSLRCFTPIGTTLGAAFAAVASCAWLCFAGSEQVFLVAPQLAAVCSTSNPLECFGALSWPWLAGVGCAIAFGTGLLMSALTSWCSCDPSSTAQRRMLASRLIRRDDGSVPLSRHPEETSQSDVIYHVAAPPAVQYVDTSDFSISDATEDYPENVYWRRQEALPSTLQSSRRLRQVPTPDLTQQKSASYRPGYSLDDDDDGGNAHISSRNQFLPPVRQPF